ncbi:MAG TPA: hypothetical protein VFU43_05855 [Streptosporangiaceae bacterium]|nr:hypothetical protein [Streptosporangiaceae bacterium]
MNDLVVANATTTRHDGGTALLWQNGDIIAMAAEVFGGRPDGFKGMSQSLENTEHHLCHAANSFYFSGFSRAAVLVGDGQGPEGDHLSRTTIWRGDRSRGLELVEDIHPGTGQARRTR